MWLKSIPKVPAKRSAVPEEVMYFRMLLRRLLLCLYFEATLLYGEQKKISFCTVMEYLKRRKLVAVCGCAK